MHGTLEAGCTGEGVLERGIPQGPSPTTSRISSSTSSSTSSILPVPPRTSIELLFAIPMQNELQRYENEITAEMLPLACHSVLKGKGASNRILDYQEGIDNGESREW